MLLLLSVKFFTMQNTKNNILQRNSIITITIILVVYRPLRCASKSAVQKASKVHRGQTSNMPCKEEFGYIVNPGYLFQCAVVWKRNVIRAFWTEAEFKPVSKIDWRRVPHQNTEEKLRRLVRHVLALDWTRSFIPKP